MPSNRQFRPVLAYAAAIAIPIALGLGWTHVDALIRGVPGYIFVVAIALIARFLGVGPAMAATVTFAAVLWFQVWPVVFPDRPIEFLVSRLLLFSTAAAILASLSRQTAVAVRRMEQMHERLVETSPDGIVVCSDTGEILYANAAFAHLMAAGNAQSLVGRNLIDLAPPGSRELMQQAVANRDAAAGAPLIEMKWVALDQRPLEVEIAKVRVSKGGEDLLHIFVRDVTARRKAEAQLDETSRRMTALFDASIDAILWIDSTGRYVDANPAACALLGHTREEIVTMHAGDFSLPQHQQEFAAVWSDVVLHRGRRGEFTILRKDGETRDIEYVAVSDVLPGFHCAFMHDITARKDAERSVRNLSARLLHVQDEERRRIARQLHDTTGQNLTAIRLILARAQQSPAAADPALRDALAEGIALAEESVGEIRTLAYLLHPPMIEDAGLAETLRWFAKGFESRSGIAVKLELPEELGRLPIRMETAVFRIVQEALTNIQRHSGSDVAAIRLERRPDALELRIEDEGHGIPAQLRGDDLLLAASGVGIAGIGERARELGGQMDIQSNDGGTVVTVTMPLPEN